MKTITIENGKALDITEYFYLSFGGHNKNCPASSYDIISKQRGMYDDIKIVYKSDSGCYPGTINNMKNSDIHYITEELVKQNVLNHSKMDNGVNGYIEGINYNN